MGSPFSPFAVPSKQMLFKATSTAVCLAAGPVRCPQTRTASGVICSYVKLKATHLSAQDTNEACCLPHPPAGFWEVMQENPSGLGED